MKVLVACKRGNIAARDNSGHCLCADCKLFRNRNNNSTKRKAYIKEWNKLNKDKLASYAAKWSQNNPDKRKAAVTSWRERNPDKVKAMNKRGGKKWSANNKDKKNAATAKRRASLIEKSGPNKDDDLIKLHYEWAIWLSEATGVPHEVDHIIPLYHPKGLHCHTNLQILPRSWNRSKGHKWQEY